MSPQGLLAVEHLVRAKQHLVWAKFCRHWNYIRNKFYKNCTAFLKHVFSKRWRKPSYILKIKDFCSKKKKTPSNSYWVFKPSFSWPGYVRKFVKRRGPRVERRGLCRIRHESCVLSLSKEQNQSGRIEASGQLWQLMVFAHVVPLIVTYKTRSLN